MHTKFELRRSVAKAGRAMPVLALIASLTVALAPGKATGVRSHTGPTCSQAALFPYGSSVVGIAATPDDAGYWAVTNDGYVAACGDATYLGQQTTLNAPVVGIASTPDGRGYYLVAADGGVFAFGDARFQGSTGSIHLNKPVVGMAVDQGTGGYWLVASDGGVFSYDANFWGSTGSLTLNKPVVGMATNGYGYYLVASDGGVFAYEAPFYGSTASITLNKPIVGMASNGNGYWLVASDGGVFAYDAPFYGSAGGASLTAPIIGMEAAATGAGYRFVGADGGVFSYGRSQYFGTPAFAPSPSGVVSIPASCSIALSGYRVPPGYTQTATITSNQPNATVTLSISGSAMANGSYPGMTGANGIGTITFGISSTFNSVLPVNLVAQVGDALCSTSFEVV